MLNRRGRAGRGQEPDYCDHCGELLAKGRFKVFSQLPFDVASALKGESAAVCTACVKQLEEKAAKKGQRAGRGRRATYLTVVPFHGRDYKSQKAVKEAWAAGKDFLIRDVSSRWDGKPINKEDADRSGVTVNVRYDKNRKVLPIAPSGRRAGRRAKPYVLQTTTTTHWPTPVSQGMAGRSEYTIPAGTEIAVDHLDGTLASADYIVGGKALNWQPPAWVRRANTEMGLAPNYIEISSFGDPGSERWLVPAGRRAKKQTT